MQAVRRSASRSQPSFTPFSNDYSLAFRGSFNAQIGVGLAELEVLVIRHAAIGADENRGLRLDVFEDEFH